MLAELSLQELELEGADLLPARTALQLFGDNVAVALAQQGAVAQANQGIFINFPPPEEPAP